MLLSESRNLPHGLCRENIAYWSPDGKYIVYSSIGKPHKCNQNVLEQDVYVYSVENGDLVNVSQSLEGISEPIGWTISNTQ
jgi:Tol biopolymer transport system component